MTTTLQSYVMGKWISPADDLVELHNAATGEVVAAASGAPADAAGMIEYARRVGGPALRGYTFHQRALMLKELVGYLSEHKKELYELSAATGATRADAWVDVDGGIGALATISSKSRREMPNAHYLVDGGYEQLSRDNSFGGVHLKVPRDGVTLQINAFNFPCWGALEKLAPAFVAGVPSIIKPATPTAFVAERLFQLAINSGILPEGSVQLLVGSPRGLLDHLAGQDSVFFTGSAGTAAMLRGHPSVTDKSLRFSAEADSLNAAILGPADAAGDGDLDRFVSEVMKELTIKVGQRCTAIRRALVPAERMDDVVAALDERIRGLRIGDPTDRETQMGPLVSRDQRDEVRAALQRLQEGCAVVAGGESLHLDVDPAGAFLAPHVLRLDDPDFGGVHEIEAFGPVTTLVPYGSVEEAAALAQRGGGSLVTSVFASDPGFARDVTLGIAPYHGRVMIVDETCAESQTGHGSPVPHLVHGGPGRAGGGEELGGVRSVHHHLHRIAVQGSPDVLTAVSDSYIRGASRNTDGPHPFRKVFEELEVGDAVVSEPRQVTLEDIEHFADFTGDRFYAHLDEAAAAASPFFEGRVAHGYLVLSFAAGLFVWPDPGPVLANYGLGQLRFLTPVYPGDTIQVALTCKSKSLREGAGYGEVTWDVEVTNQNDEVTASYDLLTMVSTREGPPPEE